MSQKKKKKKVGKPGQEIKHLPPEFNRRAGEKDSE